MKKDRIELDEVDLKLLAALQVNAAQPNQALATECGVSPATSLRRVRRLEELGLIERTVALSSPTKVMATLPPEDNATSNIDIIPEKVFAASVGLPTGPPAVE